MNRRSIAYGLVLLFVLTGVATAKEMTLSGEGPLANTVRDADWFPRDCGDKSYTENWMTMLRSDRGHVLYVNFLRTNIGVFQGSAGIGVSLTLPDQKQARHLAYEYKPTEFSSDKKTMTITIGPNSIRRKGGKIFLKVKEDGFELDLELTSWTKGVKFHDGKAFWGADKKNWIQVFIHAPRATVKGTMVLGGTKMPFVGDGYVDHLRQNVMGYKYASRWFVNRFFHKDWTLIFVGFLTPKKHGADMHQRVILTDRDEVLVHSLDLTVVPGQMVKDPKGHNYHKQFKFQYKGDGVEVVGTAAGKTVHDRNAMLERMNGAQAGVVKMVAGNPIVYRMRGLTEAKISLKGKEPVEIKGESYMESVVLKDE